MRRLLVLGVWVAAVLTALPARAISNGTIDGKLHPAVACIIGQGADGGWSGCASGQLISPTVVLTAGHATNFFATQAVHTYVSFDPVVDPTTSKLLPVAQIVTDPRWDPKNFTNSDDYGVVILEKPVKGITPLQLPTAGLLDKLKVGQAVQTLEVVGYGCSTVDGFVFTCDQIRRYANETVAAIDSQTIEMLLNNPGNNGPTGVCFGDSGGAHLLPGTNVTVGVQSSARAGCWSTARAFRLDTPAARTFLGRFVQLP